MRNSRVVLAIVSAGLLLAGCSHGGGTAAAGTSTAATSSGGSSSDAGSPTAGAGGGSKAGCPSVGRALPPGVRSAPTIDVDGDGRPDTQWIATGPAADGGVSFGIRTASGAVFSATIRSASPVARSVMFADVTGHGEVIALASDGRQVLLYAVSDCQLIPEENQQGQQYAFDLGFTGYGTGVGCVDANGDGARDLVGLKLIPEPQGAGSIQRTIVVLNGAQARNGASDAVPVTRASLADEARSVSCGDLTLTANGVSSGP
ncbi:MAG: uncharacterized protein JWO98_4095 [Frankiales bacterium]|nr:uncharacterized protein [Frankiales bacterium]